MMAGGGVKCWGLNSYGQLGIGSNTDQNRPVDVPGGQGLEWALPPLLVPSHRDPPHPLIPTLSKTEEVFPPASDWEIAGAAEGRRAAWGGLERACSGLAG